MPVMDSIVPMPVSAGTTILLVGGDGSSVVSGDTEMITVKESGDQSCLGLSSPSSMSGPPAGSSPTSFSTIYFTTSSGGYPTSSSSDDTGSSGSPTGSPR